MSDPLQQAKAARLAQAERERVKKARRDSYSALADVGELPDVVDPELKERCRLDLHLFLTELFPHTTGSSPFGPPQVQAIKRFEYAVLHFARNLTALPRGYCKSTIAENSLIWAVMYGHRIFPLFVGATQELADDGLKNIKTELETNDLLLGQYPEVCHPIRKLEGKSERCKSQTYRGERTRMTWTNNTVVLPWIDGSPARNVILESYGILSPPRGKRYRLPDGRQPRPDFAVFDDPQTDESADSDVMTRKRIKFIKKGYLRMGGHGYKMSAVMNATQLEEGDLVDQMSDRRLHKDWSTVRTQMVTKMPTHLDEWWLTKYADIRHDYDDDDIEGQAKAAERSTQFYIENHDVMNEGADVSWEEIPLEDGEHDALQHAMNILVDEGPEVFYAECQNDPKKAAGADVAVRITDETAYRQSGLSEFVVPDNASEVVFGVDVHNDVLYWTVASVTQRFSGGTIGYGTWPQQPNTWFTKDNARVKLQDHYAGMSVEEAIERGVEDLVRRLLEGPWMTPAGKSLPIGCGLVDAGYKPDEVNNALVRVGAQHVMTSQGIGRKPTDKQIPDFDMSDAKVFRCGPDINRPRWYLPRQYFVNGIYRVHFDANYWKTAWASRWTQPTASDGAWQFYGNGNTDHGHIVRHMQGERSVTQTVDGVSGDVWSKIPGYENHWLDTGVLTAVAASLCGCVLPTQTYVAPVKAARKQPAKAPRQEPHDDGDSFWVSARE